MLRSSRERAGKRKHDRVLATIAVMKFVKAALLIVLGIGAFRFLRAETAAHVRQFVAALGSSVDRKIAEHVLARISGLSRLRLQTLGVGAFLYAALYLVEGIGLWREKRWAEWLTVIATASFIPFELYELAKLVTWTRASALAINLAVVWYLVVKLRNKRDGVNPLGTVGSSRT